MTLQTTLLAYCRSIRNPEKRFYAFDYMDHQLANGAAPPPGYRCSYLAAQAVRMRINEILRNAGH